MSRILKPAGIVISVLVLFIVQLEASEIESSDRTALVEKSTDEGLREEIVTRFGDLSQYLYIWIYPERPLTVSAILEKKDKEDSIYETLFWSAGLQKDQIIRNRFSKVDSKKLLDSFVRIFKKADEWEKDTPPEEQDYVNPERVFIFRNTKPQNWHVARVRLNSQNADFKFLKEMLVPKTITQTSQAEIDSFFGNDQK